MGFNARPAVVEHTPATRLQEIVLLTREPETTTTRHRHQHGDHLHLHPRYSPPFPYPFLPPLPSLRALPSISPRFTNKTPLTPFFPTQTSPRTPAYSTLPTPSSTSSAIPQMKSSTAPPGSTSPPRSYPSRVSTMRSACRWTRRPSWRIVGCGTETAGGWGASAALLSYTMS